MTCVYICVNIHIYAYIDRCISCRLRFSHVPPVWLINSCSFHFSLIGRNCPHLLQLVKLWQNLLHHGLFTSNSKLNFSCLWTIIKRSNHKTFLFSSFPNQLLTRRGISGSNTEVLNMTSICYKAATRIAIQISEDVKALL